MVGAADGGVFGGAAVFVYCGAGAERQQGLRPPTDRVGRGKSDRASMQMEKKPATREHRRKGQHARSFPKERTAMHRQKSLGTRALCPFSANKARKGKSFEKPPLCRSRRQQAAWTVAHWCIFGSKTAKNQLFCPGKNEKSILMAPGRVGIVKMARMHLTRRKYVCPTDGRDHG